MSNRSRWVLIYGALILACAAAFSFSIEICLAIGLGLAGYIGMTIFGIFSEWAFNTLKGTRERKYYPRTFLIISFFCLAAALFFFMKGADISNASIFFSVSFFGFASFLKEMPYLEKTAW